MSTDHPCSEAARPVGLGSREFPFCLMVGGWNVLESVPNAKLTQLRTLADQQLQQLAVDGGAHYLAARKAIWEQSRTYQ